MKVRILEYKTTDMLAIWNEVEHAIRVGEYTEFNGRLYIVKEVAWEEKNKETIYVEEVKICSCC